MQEWHDTPTQHERRAKDLPGPAEQYSRSQDIKAAVAMLLVMAGLCGAWLLGAGWRP